MAMTKSTILYAERAGEHRRYLTRNLLSQGFHIIKAPDRQQVINLLTRENPDLIILGPALQEASDGLGVARYIRDQGHQTPIIIIVQDSSEDQAIAALRIGVNDYFRQPVVLSSLTASIHRLLARPRSHAAPSQGSSRRRRGGAGQEMIGASPGILEIQAYLEKVAATDATILITGETGTGKELAAELVHTRSRRRNQKLVSINCAALPDSLLESELFGFEKGAFTGAVSSYAGKLPTADGGTVFFDEIGDLSAYSQTKILRVIENKECYRLGGNQSIPMDFRIIAATNQDLEGLVAEDRFRKDLYFRINVVRVRMPPLRERRQDIPLLVTHFLKGLNRRFEREVEGLTPEALACLQRYAWPGNVRELRNLLEAVCIDLPGRRIAPRDLPEPLGGLGRHNKAISPDERDLLLSTLAATNWNKSEAAKALCWSRMTLYRKMEKHRVSKEPPPNRLEKSTRSVTIRPRL
jgi:DNA-binding NtrC family response regulator